MNRCATLAVLAASLALTLTACGQQDGATPAVTPTPPPAEASIVSHESDLLRLTLTPEALHRLGIVTAPVSDEAMAGTLTYPAEVVLPAAPGGLPVATGTELTTLGVNQIRAEGELGRAEAELHLARANLARAQAMLESEAGSIRQRDEAMAAVDTAIAARDAARRQRQLLGPGVTSVDDAPLWVRASVFAGDVARLNRMSSAQVRVASTGTSSVTARPVAGPSTASTAGGTVDFYYALPPAAEFRPGQRLAVTIPEVGRPARMLTVPAAAVLTDVHGGEWVYVALGSRNFERRRVEVERIDGQSACLSRGLAPGMQVVTAGAAELFGTEFGTK